MRLLFSVLTLLLSNSFYAQDIAKDIVPAVHTFKVINSDSLKAYVFFPTEENVKDTYPSLVIFHGGGWSIGEPSWAFRRAAWYAQKGMVAIAAKYRLSDQKSTTPMDAMEDARDVIIWMRENAGKLKIRKDRIAAYGWSAGAHLAASCAVFPSYNSDSSISSIPDALILHSPALSVSRDAWFKKLLLNKGEALDHSPAENIRGELPPSIIVIGRDDTVTPLEGSELFHQNMLNYGNMCRLQIYDGAGHLFTPSDQPDNGWPNPDKEIESKAFHDIDQFLKDLKFIK